MIINIIKKSFLSYLQHSVAGNVVYKKSLFSVLQIDNIDLKANFMKFKKAV